MKLKYKKSESTNYPELVDTTSSKKFIYLRQNIIETQKEDSLYYEYEEAKLTKKEYEEYLKELSIIDIQQQRADINYIAIMSGVDLEIEDNELIDNEQGNENSEEKEKKKKEKRNKKIKTFLDSKLWNKGRLKKMVENNIIDKDEYEEITGEKYKKNK